MYVLLIEQDLSLANTMIETLFSIPFYEVKVIQVSTFSGAMQALETIIFNLIIMDFVSSDESGMDSLNKLRIKNPNVPIVLLTDSLDELLARDVFRKGAQDYLEKGELSSKLLARVIRQATERKSVEVELLNEREVAMKSSQSKSVFLANMSHEIRTPLSAILGYTEVLSEDHIPHEERLGLIEIIRRNGQHLSKIINEILDLSKIEAGRLNIEHATFDLIEMVNEVFFLFQGPKNKSIELKLRNEGPIPRFVQSDRTRVRQILINLIGNAIKFSQKGIIEIKLQTLFSPNKNQIAFFITDNGPGICKSQRSKIFEPFGQADSTINRKYGGTGLGLILARNLARALGGDVELVFSSGMGSIFKATIDVGPLTETPMVDALVPSIAVEASVHQDIELKGVRVLVVDDTSDSQMLVKRLLERAGAEVDCANDGAEGVKKALTTYPDVVLMDIQMPEIDGYAATAKLRSQGYKKPIIAFTAHAMKEERDRCLACGCDDYASKPINRVTLLELVAKNASLIPRPLRVIHPN